MFTNENIARVVHTANKAYCEALGDYSQLEWELAPQWQRDSAIDGVNARRLDSSMTSEKQHESWCSYKINEGWTFGEIKDEKAKTHPCLVPYNKLPSSQQAKDHIFTEICNAMLSVKE